MRPTGLLPPNDDFDPDATDRLPVLEGDADEFEDTGRWSPEEAGAEQDEGEASRRSARLPSDAGPQERAADAVIDLTRELRHKSLTISSLRRELDQARSEIRNLTRGPSREVAELEGRLREVERARLELAAQHDERRSALAALEESLGEAKAGREQLERELARVRDEAAASETAREEAAARAEELAADLSKLSRAAVTEVHEQEQQRLKDRIGELQNALAVARDELNETALERDALKERIEHRAQEFIELKEEVEDRGRRIDSLLERLRTREARRRYTDDFVEAARRPAAEDVGKGAQLEARIAELERLLAAEREAKARAAATADVEDPAGLQDVGADEPTITEGDRESLLVQIAALAEEISRRDDRIAMLEAELRSQSGVIETIRDGLGLLPDAEVEVGQGRERDRLRRYLTRIDEGGAVVHVLNPPRVAIGRTADNDLQVRERHMSRHHAVIDIDADATYVEDVGSSNGVFVNGRRVRRGQLEDGDILTLGKAKYRFQVHRPEQAGV